MNLRLQQFLNAESLSQADFAESIGVARASVSHILAGRNKPGFDFILNLARRYPALNIDWFVTGRGKMYKTASDGAKTALPELENVPVPQLLFDESPKDPEVEATLPKIEINSLGKPRQTSNNKRVISKITVFYNDGTFEEYSKQVE